MTELLLIRQSHDEADNKAADLKRKAGLASKLAQEKAARLLESEDLKKVSSPVTVVEGLTPPAIDEAVVTPMMSPSLRSSPSSVRLHSSDSALRSDVDLTFPL